MGNTKMEFNFNQVDMWFNPYVLWFNYFLINKVFFSVLTAFRGFWHIYICFDPKYKTEVVASIQMLLAQRILDVAYFLHYYYCGHLLSIITIYNPEETCRYARPASVIINNHTGLKCWPCRSRTPSCHYQAFFTEYADITTFAWILDV